MIFHINHFLESFRSHLISLAIFGDLLTEEFDKYFKLR